MKTKTLLFTLFAFAIKSVFAQEHEGEIFYTDFGPEGWSYQYDFTLLPGGWEYEGVIDTLQLDLDHDGSLDCFFRSFIDLEHLNSGYDLGACIELHAFFGPSTGNPFTGYTLNCCYYKYYNGSPHYPAGYSWTIGDTISNINERDPNLHAYQQEFPFWDSYFGYSFGPFQSVFPRYIAFRFQKEDGFCYGWLEHEIDYTVFPHGHGNFNYNNPELRFPKVTVYRMAYCTIPNYPLRLGQTSFDWSLEEERERELATIHPNPTTGLVTVKGDNLHQVEVLNVMGQKVIAKQATAGETSIDLGSQPAGLYFINVTGQDGKRCVKKVVKQ